MRKQFLFVFLFTAVIASVYLFGCKDATDSQNSATPSEPKALSKDEMIKKGEYIVTTGACHDCHSPKKMTAMGPIVDSTKMLSGHPAGEPLPPIDVKALTPGNWVLFGPDLTTAVGPWGISYSANLTPDSATGTGAWTEEQFVNTIRNGKHLGNGRPILPPMPWDMFRLKTDEDLKAIYAFLRTVPAISNRVPGPVAPPDVMVMASKK